MDIPDAGVLRHVSDGPPAHYTVQVKSFSLLEKISTGRYESGTFQAGGYNWKLIFYPKGKKSKNVKEHISLYLALEGTSSLRPGWEVYATFRLFLLDQNNDKYLVVQDSVGKERRFHKMKSEWGFDEFIPLSTFNEDSNGYLVDDTCVFGAEVLVRTERNTGKGESLVMIKDPIAYTHWWTITNFSEMQKECYDSTPFTAGNLKWKIKFYPKGKGAGLGNCLSLFLALAEPTTLPPGSKIYAEVSLLIFDQMQAKHCSGKDNYWFSASSNECGWERFMLLSTFTSSYSGYLLNNACWVQANITILGRVDALSE
ncbi:hypothetical protein L6164_013743 [Bauhinia variegata]|uniref:Uncharacterized protein n=1 Tax=Bauhinia variegata TaxID=167791 RepID=A0ACB9NFP0_BAUVA|nr:hypothetical protein L6164_013743 [Bauhinia variegata]